MALLASSLAAVSVGLAQSATDTLGAALARRAERLERGVEGLVSRHSAAQAADIATRAHRLGGARALREEHALQRAARDAQAMVQHGLFGIGPHEALGRKLVSRRMAPGATIDA